MASHHPRERARRFPFPPLLQNLAAFVLLFRAGRVEWTEGASSFDMLSGLLACGGAAARGRRCIASDQMLGRTCRSDACCDLGSPLQ